MDNSNINDDILNYFGKCVIEEVYDPALYGVNRVIDLTTKNPIDQKNYSVFSDLTEEQKVKLKELMKSTTVDIIYRFLEMIEEHDDEFKIVIEKESESYSLTEISEKMGSEIADVESEEGWINRFSEL
ncbi:hypothetical protein SAMN02910370_01100 [Lachnospiraceae bacterium XPB1003]|nr:hypothetical protein SAMN02910370_01100 [Lachnospiraceae bacterium XPB1003]